MNRVELVRDLAKRSGYVQADVTTVLDALESIIVEQVHAGEEVKLFQGVTFKGEHKPEHEARNPQTGATVTVPGKMTCKVKLTNTFKDKIA